jgi:hypothetical protein
MGINPNYHHNDAEENICNYDEGLTIRMEEIG